MDDFLEHMLSTSSWGDGFGINNDMAIDSAVTGISHLTKLPPAMAALIPPSRSILGALESRGMKQPLQEGHSHGIFESSQLGQSQDSSHMMPPPRLGTEGGQHNASSSQSLTLVTESSREPQVLSNNYDSAALPHNLPPVMAPAWRQPYIPPVPTSIVRTKSDTLKMLEEVPSDAHLGKRTREEEDLMTENNVGNMIHIAQTQGQGLPDQSAVAQDPNAVTANGAVRPRVRARRGQATDPHSIAERNRRERIAERMKALQELVPDSNKTDKASMLDEIIGYVKFLQMQVKFLSMFRLGGAGAAPSLLADLPSEGAGSFSAANLAQASGVTGPSPEGMALAEGQVAQLMDKDMSAAMQYLQSKGLCLMPISLATAISSTDARQHPMQSKTNIESGVMKQAAEVQVPAAASESVMNNITTVVNFNTANNPIARDDVCKPGTHVPKLREKGTNEKVSSLPPLVQKGAGPGQE